MVTPPLPPSQRFSFRYGNVKNILDRFPYKFGMLVYWGKTLKPIFFAPAFHFKTDDGLLNFKIGVFICMPTTHI